MFHVEKKKKKGGGGGGGANSREALFRVNKVSDI